MPLFLTYTEDAITISSKTETCHFIRLRQSWARVQTFVLSYGSKYPCYDHPSPLTDMWSPHVIPFLHHFFSSPMPRCKPSSSSSLSFYTFIYYLYSVKNYRQIGEKDASLHFGRDMVCFSLLLNFLLAMGLIA